MKYTNFFLVILVAICRPECSFAAATKTDTNAEYFKTRSLKNPAIIQPTAVKGIVLSPVAMRPQGETPVISVFSLEASSSGFRKPHGRKASSDSRDSRTSSDSSASSHTCAVSDEELRIGALCDLICTKLHCLSDSGLKGDDAIEQVEEILRLFVSEDGKRMSEEQRVQILHVVDETDLEKFYADALRVVCCVIAIDIPDESLSTDE